MRLVWFAKFWHRMICRLAAGVAMLMPLIFCLPLVFAEDAAESIPQSLRHILEGGAPPGAADLRAVQDHVRKLADRVKKCVVGVRVGPTWGGGVIISKDGYVLTAAHIAGRPNRICTFTLADGSEIEGRTLGMFRTLDAGLMKIDKPGEYPHSELGDSSKLKEGQWCIAMGHPGGYQRERGVALRLGRVLLVAKDTITTDCTLVLGDFGGPLFDMDGRVIGINSRIGEKLSINMHVPVNVYNERGAWDRLVAGEVWGHLPGEDPWLGVSGEENAKEAKIATVGAGSPAEAYGIKTGDVVVAFDGREIADFAALTQAVAECRPNESVKLKVRRGDDIVEVRLRLGKTPE